MMRRLYDWMMRMAGHDKAPHALFWVSFIGESVFPIPPDVMLIPMILAQRAKAWLYATICTVGSVSAASPASHRLLPIRVHRSQCSGCTAMARSSRHRTASMHGARGS